MPQSHSHALVILIDHLMTSLHLKQAIVCKAGLQHNASKAPGTSTAVFCTFLGMSSELPR